MVKFWKPEYEVLSKYNAEVYRGITHSHSWKKHMEVLQRDYNIWVILFAKSRGWEVVNEKNSAPDVGMAI